MKYYDILSAVFGAVWGISSCVISLIKKPRAAGSLFLSAAGLASALLCASIAANAYDPSLLPPELFQRIRLSIMPVIGALLFGFVTLYPPRKREPLALAIAALIPAAATAAIPFYADEAASAIGAASSQIPILTSSSIWCFFAIVAITIFVNAMRGVNRALRTDLLRAGFLVAPALIALPALSLGIPSLQPIDESAAGTVAPLFVVLGVFAYMAGDPRRADMTRFYRKLGYWLVLIIMLFVPSAIALSTNRPPFISNPLPAPIAASALFIYMFLIFKYLRPRIESAIQRGYQRLAERADRLFLSQPLASGENVEEWEGFLQRMVDGLAEQFGFTHVHLYLSGGSKQRLVIACASGSFDARLEIETSSALVRHFTAGNTFLYLPALPLEEMSNEDRHEIREFIRRGGYESLLPFLSPERECLGILALGPLQRNRPYSRDLITVLDLFRIQLQQQIVNQAVIEEARATQVREHDRMVVESIKRKILPRAIPQVKGYRVSSFLLESPHLGGDYLDAVTPDGERLALFIADTSQTGIDAAVVSLQLYSVLHTPAKIFDAPHRVLATMNTILSSSPYCESIVSALCAFLCPQGSLLCAGAAFRPLMIYQADRDGFSSLDCGGIPLGVNRASVYETATIRLSPQSIGMICSQGLIAAINPRGETYGLDRALAVIRRHRDEAPSACTRAIHDDLISFTEGMPQTGDISVIIFKYQ